MAISSEHAFPITAEVLQAQPELTADERQALIERIKALLKARDAVLVAHYYTHEDIQMLADETGGIVSDSLEMARFGHAHPATTLVVAGVRFMGETAKILNPEKRVIMPTLEATCSLDISCPVDAFCAFKAQYPEHTVVVYANTSAAVKAEADWVVTSGIALKVIEHLDAQGESILWAPDRHLGSYIRTEADVDMVLWPGSCIVHDEFKARGLRQLKALYPDAGVLVHPESPADVIAMADVVGSTTQLIQAAKQLDRQTFIVATDNGIFYKMQEAAPGKTFIDAPTGGVGATCRSCAHCPWMSMNTLQQLAYALETDTDTHEIFIDPVLRERALIPLQRMLDFAKTLNVNVFGSGTA